MLYIEGKVVGHTRQIINSAGSAKGWDTGSNQGAHTVMWDYNVFRFMIEVIGQDPSDEERCHLKMSVQGDGEAPRYGR